MAGLKINFTKSEFVGIHIRDDKKELIADTLGARGSFPIKYLGLPLMDGSLRIADWTDIIKRIGDSIASWKGKLLLAGARCMLPKVILSNMPIYYLSMFRIPRAVCHILESMRAAFFWKGKGPEERSTIPNALKLV